MGKLSDKIKPNVIISHEGDISFFHDPMEIITEKSLVLQTGEGLFVFTGQIVQLIDIIEKQIMIIANKVEAQPVHVPTILSIQNSERSHYLDSFRNQALMIQSLKNGTSSDVKSELLQYCGMISPTVCYHYFSAIAGRNISSQSCITARSRCARHESGKLNTLERLTNFTMREIVFLGSGEYCDRIRRQILDETIKMLNDVFDLTYNVSTASDPFFGKASESKRKAQLLSQTKYEINSKLPFNDSSVSIASFNDHGSVFYDRFNLTANDENFRVSGCVGWGYERIIYSILAQKGADFNSDYYKKFNLTI